MGRWSDPRMAPHHVNARPRHHARHGRRSTAVFQACSVDIRNSLAPRFSPLCSALTGHIAFSRHPSRFRGVEEPRSEWAGCGVRRSETVICPCRADYDRGSETCDCPLGTGQKALPPHFSALGCLRGTPPCLISHWPDSSLPTHNLNHPFLYLRHPKYPRRCPTLCDDSVSDALCNWPGDEVRREPTGITDLRSSRRASKAPHPPARGDVQTLPPRTRRPPGPQRTRRD